jgi:hypothetical protein
LPEVPLMIALHYHRLAEQIHQERVKSTHTPVTEHPEAATGGHVKSGH